MESSTVNEGGSETLSVLPWWKEGRMTVCRVDFINCAIDDCQRFYDILRGNLPEGTEVFGCKFTDESFGDLVAYCTLLGFPCRLVSGAGLEGRVGLTDYMRKESPFLVRARYPSAGVDVGKSVEDTQDAIKSVGGKDLFGEPLKVKTEEGEDQVLPLFDDIDQMWEVLMKDVGCVEESDLDVALSGEKW
jgi:hypothetical protein